MKKLLCWAVTLLFSFPALSFAINIDPALIGVWEWYDDGDLDVTIIFPDGTAVTEYRDRCYAIGKMSTENGTFTTNVTSDECEPDTVGIFSGSYTVTATTFTIDWGNNEIQNYTKINDGGDCSISDIDPALIGVWEWYDAEDLDVTIIFPDGTAVTEYRDRCYAIGKMSTENGTFTTNVTSDQCEPDTVGILSGSYTVTATTFTIDWGNNEIQNYTKIAGSSCENNPPTVNAGTDQTVNSGDMVILDGSGSTDIDGNIVSYSWAQIGGSPIVALSNNNVVKPTFTAPGVSDTVMITFQLTVLDDSGLSSTDTVIIAVNETSDGDDNGGGGGCFISIFK